jgi:hypothetical protein
MLWLGGRGILMLNDPQSASSPGLNSNKFYTFYVSDFGRNVLSITLL